MPWKRALKFCWRIWQKSPGNCWSKNEWMPAPFCAVGILQDFVYCSPGLPAYLAFVWTEFCSFKQFLQKDNRREKKKENPRICFYLLPWVHSRPCPNVSAKPHKDNQNFSQLANGAMGILDRNNQETPRLLNVKCFISFHGSIADHAQEYLQNPITVTRIFLHLPMGQMS